MTTTTSVMTGDEIVALSKKHTISEWSAQGAVDPIPVARREGHLLLDARRQALHRLQQPADVRQHRPRRRRASSGRFRSRRRRWPTPTRSWRPSRAPGSARSSRRSRPATSTSSSSPTAAPRRTRTPSRSRARSPGVRRSWRATARTTAQPPARSPPPAIRGAGRSRRCPASSTCSIRTTASSAGWDTADESLRYLEEVIQLEGPQTIAGVHPRDGHRHQRHPGPAGRLPAGRARALRQARHPDDCRRGDGRLRPHRRVVRRRTTGTWCPT